MSNAANEVIKVTKSYIAGGTVADRRFVKLDSNGEIVQAVDGDQVKGASRNAAIEDGGISVALQNSGNIVQIESGAATTLGGKASSDANGRAIDSATGDMQVGEFDEGAAAINVFSIVHLMTGIIEP